MPQINRIRVNNVKYNFGTQFYDDFMMNFNCKNTIYDLANGGGKSLLMLLLLQNVIPNCTLDEKQPVEKLFRSDSGNTVIHSLVEWKLDNCYRENGYKYMTTGFCARKGHNGSDNGADSESKPVKDVKNNIDEQAVSDETKISSANIEYFNYCIFYREFGDNDIKNLPLVSNNERITYNGLKAYLRDLEKKDFNVSVRIFDRKGEYQSFISRYGLYESEWEIIRGINKTEGHVRTYFESNYRTSRKVVEDLFIEEIIQKSFNNKLTIENDEGKMAKTLFDIKDKLMELSKKHSRLDNYDKQQIAIDEFAEYVASYNDMFEKKNELKKTLLGMFGSCSVQLSLKKQEQEKIKSQIEKIGQNIIQEQKNILTAEVMCEQKEADELKNTLQVKEREKSQCMSEFDSLRKKLILMESANDYRDYKKYSAEADVVTQTINNVMADQQDVVNKLKEIASLYRPLYEKELEELKKKYSDSLRKSYDIKEEYTTKENMFSSLKEEEIRTESRILFTGEDIKEAEKRLAGVMPKTGILVAENTPEELIRIKALLEDKSLELSRAVDKKIEIICGIEECNMNMAGIEAADEMLEQQRLDCREKLKEIQEDKNKSEELKKIYKKSDINELANVILDTFKSMDNDRNNVQNKIKQLEKFSKDARQRLYVCDDPLRNKLKKYLENQYGNDVIEGHLWFEELSPAQKRDVYKRAPFVEYSFIIREDFERVRNDKVLENFERGAYAVPIMSEQILMDTRAEVNKEHVIFAMKNMDFLRDEGKLEAELRAVNEEIAGARLNLEKISDRCSIVWDDYLFITAVIAKNSVHGGLSSIDDIEKQLGENKEEKQKLEDKLESLKEQLNEKEAFILSVQNQTEDLKQCLDSLKTAVDLYEDISGMYKKLDEYKSKASLIKENAEQKQAQLNEKKAEYESACRICEELKARCDEAEKKWNELYKPYYDSSLRLDSIDGYAEMKCADSDEYDIEKLENKFKGLKAVIDTRGTDIADKKALVMHYQASMEKCIKAIEYRGITLEETRDFVEETMITAYEPHQLSQVKEQLNLFEQKKYAIQQEADAQAALLNRLLGSISHGIGQIKEKYGEFETFECNNPDSFIKQHKDEVVNLKNNMETLKNQELSAKKNVNELVICRKDLERIVSNAGIDISDAQEFQDTSETAQKMDISGYEDTAKEFESLLKLEYKKYDEFEKYKKLLMDKLIKFDSSELAREVELSVRMPESVEKADELINNLKETNSFIELEKERISSGIEQMEQIKESFENRCVQTCSNIKNQLDRLSKLSSINMNGEHICIIGLHIPYVKEETYNERMSEYIDETIMIADSFENVEERLRYIRNRLTWKRLFSVIVTDMNSIRINLYKAERIKDQSRYLRYEEAVGSTGQSQGIYIQFLIAVINYISSINASSNENAILGKTIFIDNPFGAAKDTYIWEPIFKLLKVNHVQLIVPARGATPAITGRFDVNYILGQKLAGNRIQTVVVDYFSNTDSTQLEYTRLDYEQVSFDFV